MYPFFNCPYVTTGQYYDGQMSAPNTDDGQETSREEDMYRVGPYHGYPYPGPYPRPRPRPRPPYFPWPYYYPRPYFPWWYYGYPRYPYYPY